MSERLRRIGLNEAVFRAVNEEIQRLAERFALTDDVLDLICECGNGSCAERIRMGHAEYVELRADPTTFAVVPGHEFPEAEDVVQKRGGYDVVRKKEGQPAQLAEDTNVRR